jgi:hypothetical protein
MAENVSAIEKADIRSELSGEAGTVFCSVQGGDRKSKAKVYNAMNNPTHRVGDCINKTINVKDVLAEMIEMENEETGELIEVPRVVLIDDKGESYQAVSMGIFNAVKKAIAVFGAPTWDEPLSVTVKQISLGKNQMLTFDVNE